MNYFTHSTIILILAIIILLVLLIYTNYLDKSKKVKKQVMLKLDRDEPTQDPSTTISNNTNHWSDNQLYLHSFSEPLIGKGELRSGDPTHMHHVTTNIKGKGHISKGSIPDNVDVAHANSELDAKKHGYQVHKDKQGETVGMHYDEYGKHTHYEGPSVKSKAFPASSLPASSFKSFLEGSTPLPQQISSAAKKGKTNAKQPAKQSANQHPFTLTLSQAAKKKYCNKMKCISQENQLEVIIDHLVTKTLTSDNFKPTDPQKIINNAKLLLNNKSLTGLIDIENYIHNVFYSREIRRDIPGYSGEYLDAICEDYKVQHQIENAVVDGAMIIIKNIQTNENTPVPIEEYISITHKFCVNKILQLVNLVHLFATYFAVKNNRNNIVETLSLTYGWVQMMGTSIQLQGLGRSGPSSGNPTFLSNFNKIISIINSKKFICDMEDLHKFTTFAGIGKIVPFTITGFILTMKRHVQKIKNYGLETLLKNCAKPNMQNLHIYSFFNPDTDKFTLNSDPELLKKMQEVTKKLQNVKKSNNMDATAAAAAAKNIMSEIFTSLNNSANFNNGVKVTTDTYLRSKFDSSYDKTISIKPSGNKLTFVSLVNPPKIADQYSTLDFFK